MIALRCASIASAAAFAAVTAAHGTGQQRFVSRAEGVRVDVLVTDASRRVAGLTADDFELRDNGVLQHVAALELVDRVPLDVVCVFDTSGSVAGKRLQELTAAGSALVNQLRDADRLALLSFATHVSLRSPLTSDRARLRAALAALTASGLTSLRDATFAGLALRDADPTRTLIIVFSDGDDTSSWLTPPRVIDAAKRTDVVIYAVQAPPAMPIFVNGGGSGLPPDMMRQLEAQLIRRDQGHLRFLDTVAAETGGRVVELKADADLTPAFTEILGEFRDRYVLSYVPGGVDPGGWHVLDVRVKQKSVKVVARRGYFGT